MKTKAMWLSSERARGFLALQLYSVECGSRACQVLGFVEACLGRFLSCCCVFVFCLLWCDSAQGEVGAACVVPVDPG